MIEAALRSMAPVLEKYYDSGSGLYNLLMVHSRKVAGKALLCAAPFADEEELRFIAEGALLHDIGIVNCDAPGILCKGSLPYICHGVEGRKMLEEEGMERHALVCERHTGTGLSIADIRNQSLPLPERDMCPVSLPERAICYADKFYSKSGNPEEEKTLERVISSMSRHGEDTLRRFMKLHEEFGRKT